MLRPKFPRKLDPLFLEFGCSHFEVFLVFFTSLQWNALQYPAIVPEVCMGKPGLSNVSARILRVPGETKAPHKEKTRGGVGGAGNFVNQEGFPNEFAYQMQHRSLALLLMFITECV